PIEVPKVASREGSFAGDGDTGDLDVAQIDRTAGTPVLRSDATGELSGERIEGQHPVLEVLFERPGKGGLQKSSAPSSRQQLQAETDLEDGDRGRPDGFRRQTVEPPNDDRVRLAVHEGRDHVGIEEDHDSKSAGRTGWPRNSEMSSLSPTPAK